MIFKKVPKIDVFDISFCAINAINAPIGHIFDCNIYAIFMQYLRNIYAIFICYNEMCKNMQTSSITRVISSSKTTEYSERFAEHISKCDNDITNSEWTVWLLCSDKQRFHMRRDVKVVIDKLLSENVIKGSELKEKQLETYGDKKKNIVNGYEYSFKIHKLICYRLDSKLMLLFEELQQEEKTQLQEENKGLVEENKGLTTPNINVNGDIMCKFNDIEINIRKDGYFNAT